MDLARRETLLTLAGSGLAAAAAAVGASRAHAADLAPLDPADPTAKALGYIADASKLGGKEPTYKAGSKCANCLQYKGADGAAGGACTIFPNKSVQATGWCRAWVARPAK
jgi:hypothetical protein